MLYRVHLTIIEIKVRFVINKFVYSCSKARRGHARMVAGFTTTHATSAYHHSRCEFESRLWWGVPDTTLCVKFVSDLQPVLFTIDVKTSYHTSMTTTGLWTTINKFIYNKSDFQYHWWDMIHNIYILLIFQGSTFHLWIMSSSLRTDQENSIFYKDDMLYENNKMFSDALDVEYIRYIYCMKYVI
jgi:hypothetical protein